MAFRGFTGQSLAYHKPITAIGFLDTGSYRSMINPNILPPECWKTQEEHFKAVDGKIFTTTMATKHPIGILRGLILVI